MGKWLSPGLWRWPIHVTCILTCGTALTLLVVDSPLVAARWKLNHAMFEAVPLLLVGTVFLVWLFIERPPVVEWIKQAFLGLAFVFWGIDLLLPPGAWATFLGAVVIAIYVFDLVWMIEGKIRQERNIADAPKMYGDAANPRNDASEVHP